MSPHNCTQEAVQTDGSSEGLGMEEHLSDLTHRQEVSDGPRGLCQATIDDLPDDVLLEIFDFYLDDEDPNEPCSVDKWHPLVHVCGRWRSLVFASPRRLDLRLLCTGDRSVRAMLDIWPALPIQIEYDDWSRSPDDIIAATHMRVENFIAALEHRDRVRHINIELCGEMWETLAGAMQAQFPELTYLRLQGIPPHSAVLPAGSAPRLRTLKLNDIEQVRGLLLSAGDLVHLTFSGSASLESMVACLSSLKRLESFHLEIGWWAERPSPPLQARAVLPALAEFTVYGDSKYLGDFVARIDTPMLSQLYMYTKLSSGHIFDTPHLTQFIIRARELKPCRAAIVTFSSYQRCSIVLEFPPHVSRLHIATIDLQETSMALVCGQLSPLFSVVEQLHLRATDVTYKIEHVETTTFLELFQSFTTIRGLYVSKSLLLPVATALQELIGERATEVLPNLRSLFLWSIPTIVDEVQPFLDARRLFGKPIAIHPWKENGAET